MSASSFGEYLQQKRLDRGITLRRMADLLDVSAPYLSDVEKGRRNPPEMEKLKQVCSILSLDEEERTRLFDLAGEMRGSLAPDIPEYIKGKAYVTSALRTARDLDADEKDWLRFVEELRNRKE